MKRLLRGFMALFLSCFLTWIALVLFAVWMSLCAIGLIVGCTGGLEPEKNPLRWLRHDAHRWVTEEEWGRVRARMARWGLA